MALMQIVDVFTVAERGLVVTGRVEQGRIGVGDRLWLLDGESVLIVTVRQVQMGCWSGEIAGDLVGLNVGLVIDGVDAGAVLAGHWLSSDPAMPFHGRSMQCR